MQVKYFTSFFFAREKYHFSLWSKDIRKFYLLSNKGTRHGNMRLNMIVSNMMRNTNMWVY
jgi:hypothetical protein